jgi:hypothetical protein
MHADKLSAGSACKPLALGGKKRVHAVIAYIREVLQHAHAVFRTVALVKLFYARAVLFAPAAIAPALFRKPDAASNCTLPAVFKRYIVASAAVAVPFHALVSHA